MPVTNRCAIREKEKIPSLSRVTLFEYNYFKRYVKVSFIGGLKLSSLQSGDTSKIGILNAAQRNLTGTFVVSERSLISREIANETVAKYPFIKIQQ